MKIIEIKSPKYGLHRVMVDESDFDNLNKFKWSIEKHRYTFYVSRVFGKTRRRMHRDILGVYNPKILVDHKDGNGLNNQRKNLRLCNNSQNLSNSKSRINSSSKFIGVSWIESRKIWEVKICKSGIKKLIGRFKNETDAAIAYNKAAKEVHGEFAKTNLII